MKSIEKGEYLTLEDGKEFYVIDTLDDNNQKYIYLANDEGEEGKTELLLVKEITDEEGNIIVETLDDEEEIKNVAVKMINNI